jgi:hypothetical protein
MSDDARSSSVTRIPVEAFAGQCRRHLVPLNAHVSYFEAVSLDADQQRQFLREPVESLPQSLLERLPPLRILLVPYLEKEPAEGSDLVSFEKPEQGRQQPTSIFDVRDEVFLLFGTEGQDVADYHYWLFQSVAILGSATLHDDERARFAALVFDELNRGTRGEVDDASLQWKAKLQRRQQLPGRNTKIMREYIGHAMKDTLTLYLHGLCCDIDVAPGPQQLGSRYLRSRLELLSAVFPPNPGFLVFPEPEKERPEQSDEE